MGLIPECGPLFFRLRFPCIDHESGVTLDRDPNRKEGKVTGIKEQLLERIRQLRRALQETASLHPDFTSPQVLEASAELDRILVAYQRLLLVEVQRGPDKEEEARNGEEDV